MHPSIRTNPEPSGGGSARHGTLIVITLALGIFLPPATALVAACCCGVAIALLTGGGPHG